MNTKAPKNKLTLKKKNSTTTGLIKFFLVFFAASIFVSSVFAAASGGESWKYMLFHNGPYTDMYMDFFNSMRDAGAEDVYTARNNIYPPLSLLIFKILGFIVSDELIDLPNKQRVLLQSDQKCMMVYIIFACIIILSMSTIINTYVNRLKWKNKKKEEILNSVISFALILSYPVMYCIERGNIIILSMIFTMFFIFFKDVDNKVIREISYISLAIAAGIKLYPAIFGLLLLFEKKYKDAARLIVYGIIAVFLPFVFFINKPETLSIGIDNGLSLASITNNNLLSAGGDSSALSNIIENLISFATTKKNRLNFSSVSIQNFVFIVNPINTKLASILMCITEIIALIGLAFTKKKWQQIFLLAYLMLNIPSASSSYALTFLIIPFIMFLFDEEGNGYPAEKRHKIDLFYIFCFALLLTPLPVFWFFHEEAAKQVFTNLGVPYQSKINQVLAGFVYQGMFFVIIIEQFVSSLKSKKVKKSAEKENSINNEVA